MERDNLLASNMGLLDGSLDLDLDLTVTFEWSMDLDFLVDELDDFREGACNLDLEHSGLLSRSLGLDLPEIRL